MNVFGCSEEQFSRGYHVVCNGKKNTRGKKVHFSNFPEKSGLAGFVPFFRNKFPRFFQNSKIHINPFTPKITVLILLTVCHTFLIFSWFNRFPELSRTSSFFPGLSSPGKWYNKLPGLSRFSRTRTNPALLVDRQQTVFDIALCAREFGQSLFILLQYW